MGTLHYAGGAEFAMHDSDLAILHEILSRTGGVTFTLEIVDSTSVTVLLVGPSIPLRLTFPPDRDLVAADALDSVEGLLRDATEGRPVRFNAVDGSSGL